MAATAPPTSLGRRRSGKTEDNLPPVQEFVTNEAGVEVEANSPRAGRSASAITSASGEIQPQVTFGVISVAEFDEREREAYLKLKFVGYPEQPLRVVYDPGMLTEETNAYMKDMAEDNDDRVLAQIICEALIDWDMYGPFPIMKTQYTEDGKILRDERNRPVRKEVMLVPAGEKIPLEPEIVMHFKTAWLVQIWQKINADAMGDETANPNSRKRLRRQSR